MNTNEVPQDNNKNFDGERKALYARDENGEYKIVKSTGWSVEEFFTSQAVEDLEEMTRQALDRALKGETSPMEYHMYRKRMDVVILAQVTGIFQWRIKRHLQPEKFKKLSKKLKKKYADAMDITPEEMEKLPDHR